MNKKYISYIISPIITIIILYILYQQTNAVNNTVLLSDLNSQYYPLLEHLKSIILGTNSIFYTFHGGLGANFLGTFFYYLSSPLNLLIVLFNNTNTFLIFLITAKLILASIFSITFFRHHYKSNYILEILFSLSYVFCSFNIAYFWNIMWLDAVYMAPLLLLGIDKIVENNNNKLYIFSLIYIIISNYYISFMCCIFAFIYFNYRIILKYSLKNNWKKIIKENVIFILKSLLTTLTTSFVLYVIIKNIPYYVNDRTSIFNTPISINLNPMNFFKNFLIFSSGNIDFLNPSDFHLYFGLFNLFLVLLFFFNPEISKKEKYLTLLVYLTLYLSVSCNYINYAWSFFSKTQLLNGRYTFLFSLFGILISFKSLLHIKKIKPIHLLISSLIITIAINKTLPASDEWQKYINILFLTIYLITIYIMQQTNKKHYTFLLIIVLIELEINSTPILFHCNFLSKEELNSQNKIYNQAIEYIKDIDKSFYRIESIENELYNNPILYQYNGIDVFLSTLHNDVANFFIDIGYSSAATKKATISYYSGNKIIDSLLGIKYHIEVNNNIYTHNYELLKEINIDANNNNENTILKIYKNNNALSLGFMVNKDIINIKKNINALEYQNNILKTMSKINKDIYIPIKLEKNENTFTFNNENTLPITIYHAINSYKPYDNYTININGNAINKVYDFEIVQIENNYDNNNITITTDNLKAENVLGTFASYYDEETLNEILENLKEQPLKIAKYNKTYIKGTVTSTKDKNILFTSIPYDENWNIYVNGEKTTPIRLLDTFLGIEIDSGTYTIEFKYVPKQLYTGLTISIISIPLLYIVCKRTRKLF